VEGRGVEWSASEETGGAPYVGKDWRRYSTREVAETITNSTIGVQMNFMIGMGHILFCESDGVRYIDHVSLRILR
jgi:hypothetical protein